MNFNSAGNFDLFRVGMLVSLKDGNRPMIVEMFYMDDFSQRFCDRLECSWTDNLGTHKGIFNYDDIDFFGVHIQL